MAGDWIKIEKTLLTKPEVFGIARRVGQCRTDVVGRLVSVWSWLDSITDSGAGLRIACEDIDAIAGTAGFAEAMRAEGWLEGRDGSLQVPNFERHNGNSAKARALEAEAKRLRRLSDISSDLMSDNCPTKSAENVRPENRTEEKTVCLFDQIHKFRTDRAGSLAAIAGKLFQKTGYAGTDGKLLWQVATLVLCGKLTEHAAFDSAEAVANGQSSKPIAYFRKVLETHVGDAARFKSLLSSVTFERGFDFSSPKEM